MCSREKSSDPHVFFFPSLCVFKDSYSYVRSTAPAVAYDSKQYYQQPTATAAAVAAAAQPQPSVAESYYQTGGLHSLGPFKMCVYFGEPSCSYPDALWHHLTPLHPFWGYLGYRWDIYALRLLYIRTCCQVLRPLGSSSGCHWALQSHPSLGGILIMDIPPTHWSTFSPAPPPRALPSAGGGAAGDRVSE